MERFKFNPTPSLTRGFIHRKGRNSFGFSSLQDLHLVLFILILNLRDQHIESPRTESLEALQQEIIYEMELMNRDVEQVEQALDNMAYNDDEIYRVYFEAGSLACHTAYGGCGRIEKVCFPGKLSTC